MGAKREQEKDNFEKRKKIIKKLRQYIYCLFKMLYL